MFSTVKWKHVFRCLHSALARTIHADMKLTQIAHHKHTLAWFILEMDHPSWRLIVIHDDSSHGRWMDDPSACPYLYTDGLSDELPFFAQARPRRKTVASSILMPQKWCCHRFDMSPLSSCLTLTVGNLWFQPFQFRFRLARDLQLIINISIKFDLCEFSDPLNLCRFRLWRYQ